MTCPVLSSWTTHPVLIVAIQVRLKASVSLFMYFITQSVQASEVLKLEGAQRHCREVAHYLWGEMWISTEHMFWQSQKTQVWLMSYLVADCSNCYSEIFVSVISSTCTFSTMTSQNLRLKFYSFSSRLCSLTVLVNFHLFVCFKLPLKSQYVLLIFNLSVFTCFLCLVCAKFHTTVSLKHQCT